MRGSRLTQREIECLEMIADRSGAEPAVEGLLPQRALGAIERAEDGVEIEIVSRAPFQRPAGVHDADARVVPRSDGVHPVDAGTRPAPVHAEPGEMSARVARTGDRHQNREGSGGGHHEPQGRHGSARSVPEGRSSRAAVSSQQTLRGCDPAGEVPRAD